MQMGHLLSELHQGTISVTFVPQHIVQCHFLDETPSFISKQMSSSVHV